MLQPMQSYILYDFKADMSVGPLHGCYRVSWRGCGQMADP